MKTAAPKDRRFTFHKSERSGRAADQHAVDLLRSTSLIHARHSCDFAGQAFQGGFVELTLGIGLLALVVGAVQVADDLGNRQKVAGVDRMPMSIAL